jgi:hypothetical protein
MQGLIRNFKGLFLLVLASTFVSCASQKENVTVVQDPDAKHESQIPWNKQEKWETQAALGGITDRR